MTTKQNLPEKFYVTKFWMSLEGLKFQKITTFN